MEAMPGYNDDLLIAACIAWEMVYKKTHIMLLSLGVAGGGYGRWY